MEESKSKVIPIFLETARLQGQRTENAPRAREHENHVTTFPGSRRPRQ
ncbi:unnamed protein product, partial [Ectocarpus sp. 6 AP-2014]